MGWSRPDKIRDFIRRDDKKRWRRHRTLYQQKPEQIPPLSHPAKVVQMFDTLTEQGWTFRFKIDVLSPRGFRYSAEGDTAIEAFLKAFGQWQKGLPPVAPKGPEVVAALRPPAPPPKVPMVFLAEEIRKVIDPKGDIAGLPINGRKHLNFADENARKEYRRVYMKVYRAKRRLERVPSLAAA